MKMQAIACVGIFLVAGSFAATLEDWQFEDPNGTALNSVSNSGTVGTSWNFGGPSTQAGSLNIGDTTYYKWNPGSGTTYRSAEFPELTSGQYIFEFVIADWDLAGTDGLGVVNNGIKFNFGHTTNGSAQLEFEVAQAPSNDIRVRSQNSNNGNLSGTDAQNQLGGLDLTNTASVTVQLIADLDTGEWSTKVDAESDGSFVDLVTDGTGMTMINRIQLIVDASNGTWEYGGVGGTATEFIKIDSITLSEPIPDPVWAFEFDGSSITNARYLGGTNFVLDITSPVISSTDYIGDFSFYAGVQHDISIGDLTNSPATLTFAPHVNDTWGHGSVRLQWNGAGTTNMYGEDDVSTTVVMFKKEDFVNGLDTGTIFMHETNDTLKAELEFEPKSPAHLKSGSFRWVILDDGQYYISSEVQSFTSDSPVILATSEATELSWFEYDPTTNVVTILAGASPLLQNIQAVGFWMQAVVLEDADGSDYPSFRLYSFSAAASKSGVTPTSLWNDWIGGYPGVGANSGLLDHGDSDDLDNLTEYAFGGDPSDGGSQGNVPSQAQVVDGGTNYIEYIYYERTDAGDRGLASILEVGTDLVITNWADGSGYEYGSGASGIAGFNAVTNRIPTDTEAKQFIRLQIEFTP